MESSAPIERECVCHTDSLCLCLCKCVCVCLTPICQYDSWLCTFHLVCIEKLLLELFGHLTVTAIPKVHTALRKKKITDGVL